MYLLNECIIWYIRGFLGGAVVENPPANAGDMDLIPVKNTQVWRKGNPLTLLVGMQTSTATMENSVEIS